MDTQARRLAMVTALLWFGVGGQAQAGPVLMTPAGLSPGDHFRFVFVTDGTTTATSSNIADYNSFVNTQAGGATYNGMVIPWAAIASTRTVNAIDNVVQTRDPVYLADGTKVTTSTTAAGLWSSTLLHPINEALPGQPTMILPTTVWTGTGPAGSPSLIGSLGSLTPIVGSDLETNTGWVQTTLNFLTVENRMYGISFELTVVPEPSSLLMAGTVLIAGSAYGWSRHRRDQRRQRPVGSPAATE